MIVSYRSDEHLDVKTTIGDAQSLLDFVQELPIRCLVGQERLAFESNWGPLERPSDAHEAEAVVCAILALKEAVRLFHECKDEETLGKADSPSSPRRRDAD